MGGDPSLPSSCAPAVRYQVDYISSNMSSMEKF